MNKKGLKIKKKKLKGFKRKIAWDSRKDEKEKNNELLYYTDVLNVYSNKWLTG